MTISSVLRFAGLALLLGLSLGVNHVLPLPQPGAVKLPDGQQQTNVDTPTLCSETMMISGKNCILLGSNCDKDVCFCSYSCESDSPSQVPSDLATFDRLPVEEQKSILTNKGPFLPARFEMNGLSMRALGGDNWPFYVAYSLKEGTAVLTISASDTEPFSQELKAGRSMQALLKLPGRFGSEPRVARISFQAPPGSEFELHAIRILEKEKGSKEDSSHYWTVKFPDGQQRTKDDVCATALIIPGQKCVLVGSICDKDNHCSCSYSCLSTEAQAHSPDQSGPPSEVETDLAVFDKLPLAEQKAFLFDNGPLVPASFEMNDMSMRGFVRDNWPFFVLYSLKGGSAFLTITVYGIEPFSQELKTGEKMEARFKLPEAFGSELRVAKISFRSQPGSEFELLAIGILDEDKSSKDNHSRYRIPVDMQQPISDVTLIPSTISTKRQERASYWFFSRSMYSAGAADFVTSRPVSKDESVSIRVFRTRYENIKANEKTEIRQWDGRDWHGQFSFGPHRLQIRAWRGQASDGKWVGPYYSSQVEVVQ